MFFKHFYIIYNSTYMQQQEGTALTLNLSLSQAAKHFQGREEKQQIFWMDCDRLYNFSNKLKKT